jgi:ribosomal protein L1
MVKIGKSDMMAKEIVENIMAAVPEIVTRIPKKWKNIQSICISF